MADNVSELVARILDTLASSSFEEINWICRVPDELRAIKQTLASINAVLLDAQEHQSTSKSTALWLRKLKLIAYDIEDVLDLIATQDLELRVNGRSLLRRITKLFTWYDVARELRAIRQRLDEVERCKKSFGFRFQERHAVPLPAETCAIMQRETCSYVREWDVIGRKEDKDSIISAILMSSSGAPPNPKLLSVIPIIGLGGMGKTTLAKLIFNDAEVIARFELRLWAHVSSRFVLKNLILNILRTATGMNFSDSSLELLQKKLCEVLGGKTYLLVLDDVWARDPIQWMDLKELLCVGSSSNCTIILTTREERVALIAATTEPYRLKRLSDGDCWSIFAKYAFNHSNEQEAYPLLVEIGKSIVQKCHGVPLAARTLGSMLRHQRDAHSWRQIDQSELWRIEQGPNDILPALKLSYDQTPYHLRLCFTFCAVFKKGCPLFRFDLVNMWMALGFLQSSRQGDADLEAVGNKYFLELLSRSFLQFSDYDVPKAFIAKYGEFFDESSFWNDLVHMSKTNLFQSLNLVSRSIFQPVERLLFLEMHDLLHDLAAFVLEEEIVNMTSSRTQEISPRAQYVLWDREDLSTRGFPVQLWEEASRARVFAFVHPMGCVSKSFLQGVISSFRCLRILNLNFSEFEELPNTIGDLKHLRYLNLASNSKLTTLPPSTCKLVNLQSLNLFGCTRFEWLPKHIHRLVNLRYLCVTSKLVSLPKEGLCGLRSLRVMRFFCPHLRYLSTEIGSLENLRCLEIIYCAKLTTLPNEMKYLTNLEELKVYYCRSLDLKEWEGLRGLTSLQYLDFIELPKLVGFPEGLDGCANSLRFLRIVWCEGLRTLPEQLHHNTSLLNVSLSCCPNLTALPRGIKALRYLQQLNIDGCPELRKRCEKKIGSDWHLIAHIPEIRIDHEIIQSNSDGPYACT